MYDKSIHWYLTLKDGKMGAGIEELFFFPASLTLSFIEENFKDTVIVSWKSTHDFYYINSHWQLNNGSNVDVESMNYTQPVYVLNNWWIIIEFI